MTNKSKPFSWKDGDELPKIAPHTDAKLRLLADYLDRYFDVVCALPQMDVLRIALVDAFAGGGLYQSGGSERFGSPLVMIDAVRRARDRINKKRRKPLRIEAKFYFVDSDANAIDCLRQNLAKRNISEDFRDLVTVKHATASKELPAIIRKIADSSHVGRSIFFLDQCGYTDVHHADVRLILQSLPKSEVIVTYNFGAIYDYMNENAQFLAAVAPLELRPDHIKQLLKERDRQAGRYFAGRLLGQLFKARVGSQFTSRFFLHSDASNRDMWFVHYSKVPRSRLVMSQAHWATKNSSITQGEAGLDMLGFTPKWEHQIVMDFGFEETDEGRMHSALVRDLPNWLNSFDTSLAPTLDTLLALNADNTAATEFQIKSALKKLEAEDEIEILTPRGARKRSGALIGAHHRIILPRQRKIVFLT